MSAVPESKLTVQGYLARERENAVKHEFLRGKALAMGEASRRHNLITANITAELREQLRDRDSEVYAADMRVKVDTSGLYTYPDVTVVCSGPDFEDGQFDTLLNPIVLFEVLSPSTSDYDRGGKFAHYRQLPSLQEYVLISQDRCLVEHYLRQSEDQWMFSDVGSLQGLLALPTIGCELQLSEIYLKVTFDESQMDLR